MALVEHWRTDFDTDAKTNKFFYSPAPGGLANIADVRRVVQDGVSCIEINIGSETPTVEYFSTPNGGTDAYAKMVADVANQPNGAIAYVYSRDSTKHGRYVKAGGAWGARTGSVTPKMANDENHRRVAQIRLLLQSWSAAADPYAPRLMDTPISRCSTRPSASPPTTIFRVGSCAGACALSVCRWAGIRKFASISKPECRACRISARRRPSRSSTA